MVPQHEGFVHTGERLVLRILQQAGRTDRQRIAHLLQEVQELVDHGDRQGRRQKAPHDLLVVGAVNRKFQQVVFAQEIVEQVGGQHQRRRHGNANAGKPTDHAALVQQVPYEGQAARFAAQRTAADLQEESICRLKCCRIELADERLGLLAAILGDGCDKVAPQVLSVLEVGNFARPQLLGEGKLGARHQPVREVVALGVVFNAFGRDRRQLGLQFVQVTGAPDLGLAVGEAEDEVAEARLVHQHAPQIAQQGRRALLQEAKALVEGALHELGAAGLQHDGHIRHDAANHARQLESGFRRERLIARKFHIRHQDRKVVAILHDLLLRVLVIGTEEDLGPGPHAHQLVRYIEALAEQAARLADQLGVNHRQEEGVIADIVLHHQHYGNAHGMSVMQDVALVFDVLDDRDQDAGIALPQKYAFDIGLRIARDKVLDLAVIVGQNDDRNIETGGLNFARQLRGIHVAHLQVGHDQVEARLGARQFQRFRSAGDMRDAGDLMNVQLQRLAHQQLVEAPVLAQDEGVVQAGDQQNVVHAERHQVLEALELELRGRDRIGNWANRS